MEGVIFAHKPILLDVTARLKRSTHTALGLAINCTVIPVAGQRTHRTTFRALKVFSHVAALVGGGQNLRSVTALFSAKCLISVCMLAFVVQDTEISKFKAATKDEIERLKNQLKWQVRPDEMCTSLYSSDI